MISKLQPRLFQPASVPAAPAPSAKVSSKPRLDTFAPSPAARPLNTALRTLQGNSVFESAPKKAGQSLGLDVKQLGGDDLFPFPKSNPREAAVEKALAAKGGPVSFENTDGKTEEVSISEVPGSGGNTYTVQVGDDSFTVEFEEGTDVDREAVLAQVIDSYSETPADLRGSLENIVISAEDGDGAAATAGDGTITFYDNDKNVTADIFHHEIGHLIGRQVEEEGDSIVEDIGEIFTGEKSPPIPDGWEEAAAADGNHLNEYTEESFEESGNYTEDFAEAWSEYMRAIDQGPEALQAFEQKYPERSEILEDLYPPPA